MPDLNILGHRTCTACHLRAGCSGPVPGSGGRPEDVTLMFVGEAPGKNEDEQGEPFVGKAGQLLKDIIANIGIDMRRVFFSNRYHCRPAKNNIALAKGSICDKIWLPGEIQRLPNVEVIVALGRTALSYFLPGTEHEAVAKLAARDTRWPDAQSGPLWVVGAYHPSAVLRAGVESGAREGNIKFVSLIASVQRALYYMKNLPYEEE